MSAIDFSKNSPIAGRFMRYVKVYTTSDPDSETQPSTERQKDLGRILVEELKALGIDDAELVDEGYVYATIPATVSDNAPVLCLCAHMDTAPDCSGENVKPILHQKYDGQPIALPDDTSVVITTDNHPYLKTKIGDDLITASGLTLLGADDKAGVAVIMHVAEYLMKHPEVKHGKIRILFTPDEEVGRGVDAVDMKKLGADFGYTLDGGECPHLEDENFSADGVKVTFHGVSAHPGYAKGKLKNAVKIASDFVASLPKNEWNPESTEGREGFVHPVSISGGAETAVVQFIIRDFDSKKLAEYEQRLEQFAKAVTDTYEGARYQFEVKEQYRNMKEILDQHPEVMAIAEKAYQQAGLNPQKISIRGGTDGSRLSFMGLPCPNIFTGEMAIHSRQEYVSVQDMEKSAEVCVHLATITAAR